MTPQQLIDRVVSFEKDLAAFYEELQLTPNLKPLERICRFMAQHSAIHAELISNYRSDAELPKLEIDPLGTLHDRLKASLRKALAATDDIEEAARKLSQAEEIVGLAYSKIADHYAQVSDTYRMLSSKFASLAEDERSHCNYILREKQRLVATRTDTSPDRVG